ncbi:M81 family metallopeptidase [Membranihabitans maritimus]|uniref:M81 family metallopeptidase n=1 Tax=Membranihabitans maritimus TaxID=2904244 RepID=UPI001F3F21A4|nr:M81 family metallopeptidase [Membranihabitans maritimus]
MKITFYLLCAAFYFFVSCSGPEQNNELPRIAIAGIAIESSTFSPAVTYRDGFRIKRGNEIFTSYPFMEADSANRKKAEWLPALTARAIPGGIVDRETYESMSQEILDSLKSQKPLDGLFFDIHGAMSVQDMDDPEGDLIERIREVIGPETLISTSMDLHGNVTHRLAKHSDLITCYRLAPHEDALESKKRAMDNLLERLESGKGKPEYKAYIPVPILLPGEKTSTRVEPGKSLYAKVDPATQVEGVIDAAIWMGYPWADEPRNHGVVMVTGDGRKEVASAAKNLAQSYWDVRHDFEFVAPTATLKESLDKAVSSDAKPFMISDSGDNPTAGGAGDVTWTLEKILARPEFQSTDGPSLIYASIPGPELVEEAVRLGIGEEVEAIVGAAVDDRYAPPLELNGTITAIEYGDPAAETEVVVKVGSVSVIVTKKRKPYHRESDFNNLELNPRETDIVVVKIGYLVPELYDMRKDWLLALTPGGVDQDLLRLDYKRIQRPMIPFDPEMDDPDLSVQWIPAANEEN